MADAADRNVARLRHLGDERRALGGETFAPKTNLGHPMIAAEHLGKRVEHDVREFLAVVEQPDAQAAQRLRPVDELADGGGGRRRGDVELQRAYGIFAHDFLRLAKSIPEYTLFRKIHDPLAQVLSSGIGAREHRRYLPDRFQPIDAP